MNGVILFNPWSARNGYRIPNSILQVGASIQAEFQYVMVDGNRENNPWKKIEEYLASGKFSVFGCTVMPGPQLQQAIPFTKKVKELFPSVITVWGGYFASNQYKTCLDSGFVDFIIDGPGDHAFPQLLRQLKNGKDFEQVPNLIYKQNEALKKNPRAALADQDMLPSLPYDYLDKLYPLRGYLKKTFLGRHTAAYHSSIGCPFTCSFCAVVPIYNARWKGKSAKKIYAELLSLIDNYKVDAVEFHDNNFFVSEQRTREFSQLIMPHKISWWGEGRIDTVHKYSDDTLYLMKKAGCKMIFFGAETSNDDTLNKMDKGGTQNSKQMLAFAARLKRIGIIPEYSFVLGMPAPNEQSVMSQIVADIEYIKKLKEVNEQTEIILYIYSPVPTEGSELYESVKASGFKFPENLQDWLRPEWISFDLRRNPLTPWLKPYMVDTIRNFETVLNSYYPTISDFKISGVQRKFMRAISAWRYRFGYYSYPYELRALQRFWLRYRQPEQEGFAMD